MKQVNIQVPNYNNPNLNSHKPLLVREIEQAMLNVKAAIAANIRAWAEAKDADLHRPPCSLNDLSAQLQALAMMSASVQSKVF